MEKGETGFRPYSSIPKIPGTERIKYILSVFSEALETESQCCTSCEAVDELDGFFFVGVDLRRLWSLFLVILKQYACTFILPSLTASQHRVNSYQYNTTLHPPNNSNPPNKMIKLVAFDLDGTLAESKQAILDSMGEALADLLTVAHVAVISGGDWPQFQKQVASRLPVRADLSKLWLMPTTGTKLYTHKGDEWKVEYAELFSEEQRKDIIEAFNAALDATGFQPEQTWGERIEDRGSQITFSALGQQAPPSAKEVWDPDFEKRKIIQADLYKRLPDLSINMGGATSIDITQKGVDKGYGLKKLSAASGIPLEQIMFIGDAIFPGGNDYPAKELGLHTVRVKNPDGTLAAIAGIVACLSETGPLH